MATSRTYWLSFSGDSGFRGGCLVDVDTSDYADAAVQVFDLFPDKADDGDAIWIAAAGRKAHRMKCNPGGSMVAFDVTDRVPLHYPKGQLLQPDDMERLDGEKPTRVTI